MFHRTHDDDSPLPKPCPQMAGLLSPLADGTLRGFLRWYAAQHVKGCPACGANLSSLQALRERVRALGVPEIDAAAAAAPADSLSPEWRARLEQALIQAEGGAG